MPWNQSLVCLFCWMWLYVLFIQRVLGEFFGRLKKHGDVKMQVFDVGMQLEWFDVLLFENIPKYTTTFAKRVRQIPLVKFYEYHILNDNEHQYECKQAYGQDRLMSISFMGDYVMWIFISYYQFLPILLNVVMSRFCFCKFYIL